MASFPSFYVARTKDQGTMEMIGGLAKLAGAETAATVKSSNGLALCRILEDGPEKILFVFNHGPTETDALVDTVWAIQSVEKVHGDRPNLTSHGSLRAQIPARSVMVCLLRTA